MACARSMLLIALWLAPHCAGAQPANQPLVPTSQPAPPASQPVVPTSQPRASGVGQTQPVYEVVVTGRRPVSRDQTAGSTRVRGQRLRDASRSTLLEAVAQESADMYVTGSGVGVHGVASGASGSIHVRGMGGSPNTQVLMVEDGVPDYQGIFGHPIPDAYVPFLVDEVLLVKGGDSVLYGSNAMGAVIELRSRWRHAPGFELQNDAALGSYNTVRESVALLGQVGRLDLSSAVSLLRTDGHRVGAGGATTVAQVGLRWRLGPLRLGLRQKLLHLQGGDPGPATHPYTDHWFDVWRSNTSLPGRYSRGPLQLSVTPYINVGIHRLYDGFYSRDVTGGGSLEANWRLHRRLRLLLGLAGEWIDGSVEDRIAGTRQAVEPLGSVSAYGQATLRVASGLSLVVGGRGLVSNRHGPVPLYKAGLRWQLYRGLWVRGRVTRNFRQPTLRELYLPFPTANPDLRPEYALNADLELGYDADHVQLSVSGYRSHADDMIRYFGAWPTAEVVNIDHITVWGVEGRLLLRDMGPVSASITGNWQDVGRYTRQNPSGKINVSLEAARQYGRHRVSGCVGGEWVHGLYMDNYARNRIRDLFVIDLMLRHRYTTAGLTLEPYVALRNLLDMEYAYIKDYPMPGFNLLAGLRLGR